MASSFVVDACALVKTFAAGERHADEMTAWIRKRRSQGADLLAPPPLRYEIGHVLARTVTVGMPRPGERRRILEHALLGFRFVDPVQVEEQAPPLSFYDASYLALAQATDSALVTYDATLDAAAKGEEIDIVAPGR